MPLGELTHMARAGREAWAFRGAPASRPCPGLFSQLMEGSNSAFRASRANRSTLLPGPDMGLHLVVPPRVGHR
jgi:hypothetical protein